MTIVSNDGSGWIKLVDDSLPDEVMDFIFLVLEGSYFSGKESSYLASSLLFSSSLQSSYSVVGTWLAFYTLVDIRKHYWANC